MTSGVIEQDFGYKWIKVLREEQNSLRTVSLPLDGILGIQWYGVVHCLQERAGSRCTIHTLNQPLSIHTVGKLSRAAHLLALLRLVNQIAKRSGILSHQVSGLISRQVGKCLSQPIQVVSYGIVIFPVPIGIAFMEVVGQ